MAETDNTSVMSLTVTLLSAYFANNTVPSGELPALVDGTRRALLGDTTVLPETFIEDLSAESSSTQPAPEVGSAVSETTAADSEFKPAVSIEESLASPDQILSLIDGKPYKALKRHLAAHGLTPAEYRRRYNLPADYPTVAPGYSAARREVAMKLGLGGKRKEVQTPAAEVAPQTAEAEVEAEAAKSAAVEAATVISAPARRSRAKGVTAQAKAPVKTPKRAATKAAKASTTSKGAADRAPAAMEDIAPKRKRSRATMASAETPAATEPLAEAAATAE